MNEEVKTNVDIAACCWCEDETSHLTMNSALTMAFVNKLDDKDKVIAALEEYIRVTEDEPLSKIQAQAIREMVDKLPQKLRIPMYDKADILEYANNLEKSDE